MHIMVLAECMEPVLYQSRLELLLKNLLIILYDLLCTAQGYKKAAILVFVAQSETKCLILKV